MSWSVWGLKLVSMIGLAAALAPMPAAARDHRLAEVEDRLSDPRAQHAMGDALAAMMTAMMSIKAAPFVNAMDSVARSTGADERDQRPISRDFPADATLGDLAGPDARDMPRQMARKVPQMMGAMGAMTGAMGEMLPQLEAMGRRIARDMNIEAAKADDRAD